MMKKLLALFMLLCLSLTVLTACGPDEDPNPNVPGGGGNNDEGGNTPPLTEGYDPSVDDIYWDIV